MAWRHWGCGGPRGHPGPGELPVSSRQQALDQDHTTVYPGYTGGQEPEWHRGEARPLGLGGHRIFGLALPLCPFSSPCWHFPLPSTRQANGLAAIPFCVPLAPFLGEPQAGRRAALSFGERACVGRFCCCQAARRTGGPSLNLLRLPFAQIQKAITMPTRCWTSEDCMRPWMCSVLRPVRDRTSFGRSYSPCLSGFCSLGIFFAPRWQRMLRSFRSPVLGECFFLSSVSCPDVGTTSSLKSAVRPGGWGRGEPRGLTAHSAAGQSTGLGLSHCRGPGPGREAQPSSRLPALCWLPAMTVEKRRGG